MTSHDESLPFLYQIGALSKKLEVFTLKSAGVSGKGFPMKKHILIKYGQNVKLELSRALEELMVCGWMNSQNETCLKFVLVTAEVSKTFW